MKFRRSCIYPKDVQLITGKSGRAGRRLLEEIKEKLGKESHQFITLDEFADYTGIPLEVVQEYIRD